MIKVKNAGLVSKSVNAVVKLFEQSPIDFDFDQLVCFVSTRSLVFAAVW